ncbi:MAG: dihydroorotate dehydrogenase electron transfer subunit [Candidatus Eisenbacteria bacterium]|nr:dihydroorotate dehydrogenase electron transfer subunit [Candidatus Eisenbacteria bacterium]
MRAVLECSIVRSQKEIGGGLFHLEITLPSSFPVPDPGQFLHVRITEGREFLLRRPFSISDFRQRKGEAVASIIYSVRGLGTSVLLRKKKGESLDIIGPLGNGFKIEKATVHLLVAGGRGIAPLLFLGRRMREKGIVPVYLYGTKTWDSSLFETIFEGKASKLTVGEAKQLGRINVRAKVGMGSLVLVSTEDRREGFKGKVTELFLSLLKSKVLDSQTIAIYSCGPTEMVRKIARISVDSNLPCQVSLEERFLCGIGLCMGCSIPVKEGGLKVNRRVCSDGPVFRAHSVCF